MTLSSVCNGEWMTIRNDAFQSKVHIGYDATISGRYCQVDNIQPRLAPKVQEGN